MTFLFTDIEGSTRSWERDADTMADALERHDAVLRAAIETNNGVLVKSTGDGMLAVFSRVTDACAAAIDAQQALIAGELPPVRMGLHTGESVERDGDYFGPTLNRAARLMAIGHGGQVLMSQTTRELVPGADATHLGEHHLKDLAQPEQVYQLIVPGAPADFPPLRSLDAVRTNLPTNSTTFVGRDAELDELERLVTEQPIVTLTGPGGVGKTRLALQTASRVLDEFPDGTWFVELAGVTDANAVDEAVGSVVGARPNPGQTMRAALVESLRRRRTLVVVDNCEHLVGAVAACVEAIASHAPSVHVLATSRERLAIGGERMVPLSTLDAASATRLFVERATAVRPGFGRDTAHSDAIAQCCERLDGIPLAIELAAARVRSLTPEQIAGHLDQRFRLLKGGPRDAAARQQTLRDAIDWSYQLLNDHERLLLRRLGVFTGSFDLAAVEAIATDDLFDALDVADTIEALVDKSLLQAETSGTVAQYRLLEMIRDYAHEQLGAAGETDALLARHAEYYVDLVEQAGVGLLSPDELVWNERLGNALDNTRAALAHLIDVGDVDAALRMVGAVALYGNANAARFGVLAEQAARLPGAAEHPLVSVALGAAAFHAVNVAGLSDKAFELADEAWAALPEPSDPVRLRARCRTYAALNSVFAFHSRFDRMEVLTRRWLDDAQQLGDPFELSQSLNMKSGMTFNDLDAAELAVRYAREMGSPTVVAISLMMLGPALRRSDPLRARAILEESIALARRVGNDWVFGFASIGYAGVLHELGERDAAMRELFVTARATEAANNYIIMMQAVIAIGSFLTSRGDAEGGALAVMWCRRLGFVPILEMPTFFGDQDAVAELAATVSDEHRAEYERAVAQLDAEAVLNVLEVRANALEV